MFGNLCYGKYGSNEIEQILAISVLCLILGSLIIAIVCTVINESFLVNIQKCKAKVIYKSVERMKGKFVVKIDSPESSYHEEVFEMDAELKEFAKIEVGQAILVECGTGSLYKKHIICKLKGLKVDQ